MKNFFLCCSVLFCLLSVRAQAEGRFTVLLDAGHGVETPGKRSPDGFREAVWCRSEVQELRQSLSQSEFDVFCVTPEDEDVKIPERVARINKVCDERGAKNCLLISLHCNASPGQGWHSACGFMVFVSEKNASNNSKRFAQLIFDEAERHRLLGNRSIPAEHYWQKDLGILRDSHCPAVLIEAGFMDCKTDLDFLRSNLGQQTIVEMTVNAIRAYKAELGID
ncbi:MAG: N-acetylmuramoyl-L-alanine amidase [Bacteroidales bacterium]|nr:N-acetylmuramoyl-L-alanine amidase [Bacteroidales bacterium]